MKAKNNSNNICNKLMSGTGKKARKLMRWHQVRCDLLAHHSGPHCAHLSVGTFEWANLDDETETAAEVPVSGHPDVLVR
jgi:hypothetical protein